MVGKSNQYDNDIKQEALSEYLNCDLGYTKIADKYRISRDCLRNLVRNDKTKKRIIKIENKSKEEPESTMIKEAPQKRNKKGYTKIDYTKYLTNHIPINNI